MNRNASSCIDFSVLDTIRFKQERTLRRTTVPTTWRIRQKGSWSRYYHRATKLRVSFDGNQMEYAEVELPRLLFNCNSCVIASQSAVNRAVRLVSTLLDEITHPARSEPIYTRIDLVWQIKGEIRDFILAYQHARTRFVRSTAQIFPDSGLRWKGNGFVLQMCDKSLKNSGSKGKIVRIELQLQRKPLETLIGKNIRRLDFHKLYSIYRETLLSLNQTPVPKLPSLPHVLAFCEQQGIPAVAYWSAHKSTIHVRRIKKQVASIQIRKFQIDMKNLFPLLSPPNPVQIFHIKKRKTCALPQITSSQPRHRARLPQGITLRFSARVT